MSETKWRTPPPGECPKVPYATEEEAVEELHELRKSRPDLMRAYQCNCGQWHLTSSGPKMPRHQQSMLDRMAYREQLGVELTERSEER